MTKWFGFGDGANWRVVRSWFGVWLWQMALSQLERWMVSWLWALYRVTKDICCVMYGFELCTGRYTYIWIDIRVQDNKFTMTKHEDPKSGRMKTRILTIVTDNRGIQWQWNSSEIDMITETFVIDDGIVTTRNGTGTVIEQSGTHTKKLLRK